MSPNSGSLSATNDELPAPARTGLGNIAVTPTTTMEKGSDAFGRQMASVKQALSMQPAAQAPSNTDVQFRSMQTTLAKLSSEVSMLKASNNALNLGVANARLIIENLRAESREAGNRLKTELMFELQNVREMSGQNDQNFTESLATLMHGFLRQQVDQALYTYTNPNTRFGGEYWRGRVMNLLNIADVSQAAESLQRAISLAKEFASWPSGPAFSQYPVPERLKACLHSCLRLVTDVLTFMASSKAARELSSKPSNFNQFKVSVVPFWKKSLIGPNLLARPPPLGQQPKMVSTAPPPASAIKSSTSNPQITSQHIDLGTKRKVPDDDSLEAGIHRERVELLRERAELERAKADFAAEKEALDKLRRERTQEKPALDGGDFYTALRKTINGRDSVISSQLSSHESHHSHPTVADGVLEHTKGSGEKGDVLFQTDLAPASTEPVFPLGPPHAEAASVPGNNGAALHGLGDTSAWGQWRWVNKTDCKVKDPWAKGGVFARDNAAKKGALHPKGVLSYEDGEVSDVA